MEVLRQRYLSFVPTILPEPQPSCILIVAKVTTDNLNLEASLSFEVPINTRLFKNPALLILLLSI